MRHYAVVFLSEPLWGRAPRGCVRIARQMDVLVNGLRVVVPVGQVSDGGSIPAVLWLPVGNQYSGSAVRAFFLHDWMYRNPTAHRYTRAQADEILYCALRAEGAATLRARCIYLAVRLFGRFRAMPS